MYFIYNIDRIYKIIIKNRLCCCYLFVQTPNIDIVCIDLAVTEDVFIILFDFRCVLVRVQWYKKLNPLNLIAVTKA